MHLGCHAEDFTIIHDLFGVVSAGSLRTRNRTGLLFKDAVLSIMLYSQGLMVSSCRLQWQAISE